MSTENVLSVEISKAELQEIKDALAKIRNTLAPYLIALTPEQRMTIPKMSDRTKPFVGKAMGYAVSDAKFVPPYLDIQEMKKDYDLTLALVPIHREIAQLENNISDTQMLAGSEAYVAALNFYNSVKMAEKLNIPGAKSIYEDLKKRFNRPAKGDVTE